MDEDHWLNDDWLAGIRVGQKYTIISSRLPAMNLPLFDDDPTVEQVIAEIPKLSWVQRRLAARWLARRGEAITGTLAAALEESKTVDGWMGPYLTSSLNSYYEWLTSNPEAAARWHEILIAQWFTAQFSASLTETIIMALFVIGTPEAHQLVEPVVVEAYRVEQAALASIRQKHPPEDSGAVDSSTGAT